MVSFLPPTLPCDCLHSKAQNLEHWGKADLICLLVGSAVPGTWGTLGKYLRKKPAGGPHTSRPNRFIPRIFIAAATCLCSGAGMPR